MDVQVFLIISIYSKFVFVWNQVLNRNLALQLACMPLKSFFSLQGFSLSLLPLLTIFVEKTGFCQLNLCGIILYISVVSVNWQLIQSVDEIWASFFRQEYLIDSVYFKRHQQYKLLKHFYKDFLFLDYVPLRIVETLLSFKVTCPHLCN